MEQQTASVRIAMVQCVLGGNTSQYVYGADGLRRTSIVNGNPVHSVLDSGMMIREMIPSGQTLIPKATYLIGPRGPEYRRDDQTGAIRWYLYDGLGSVLAEVDPAGNLTASPKYDVYGLVRAGDSGTSRHKFVGSLGHTSEDETGMIYMRARWMDPATGHLISEDPARDGANWFEYCRGNPVNAVGADGRAYTLCYALQSAAPFGVMNGVGDLAYQAIYSWLRAGSVSVDWGEVAAWTVGGAAGGATASASAIMGSFLGTFSWAAFGRLLGAAVGLGVGTGGISGAVNALRFRDAQVRAIIFPLFDEDCGPERQRWN